MEEPDWVAGAGARAEMSMDAAVLASGNVSYSGASFPDATMHIAGETLTDGELPCVGIALLEHLSVI